MSDASLIALAPRADPATSVVRCIVAALLAASAVYFAATSALLPAIHGADEAADVFLAAVLPGLMVVLLLWAVRPAAFPQRRRAALIAVTLLAATAASILPALFAAS